MFETTNELLNQIRLGEDSSLVLKDLKYKGDRVIDPLRNSVADELAAMANTGNGVIVFGVDDKTNVINGIPVNKLDIVEAWTTEICNDFIDPPLDCRIRKIPVPNDEDGDLIIIRVDVPRSLFVHKSSGGYFKRLGSSKRDMSPEVLARLFQQRSQTRMIYFDEQSVSSATRESLDKNLWGKFRTKLSPQEDSEFLFKLKLITKDEDGKVYPSVSGLLLACQQPQEFLPNAFIQAVSYRGTKRNSAYQLDARDIVGPVDIQIMEACKFVEKNMKTFAVKEPGRIEIQQYSSQAVFEAIVNAVTHRDYSIYGSKIRLQIFSDRLEIFSPGTAPNSMTIDTLHLRQSTRNELLTSLLARYPLPVDKLSSVRQSYMDKRGEGVPIIYSKSEKLSGKRPEYQLIDDNELLLTIFAAPPPEIY